MSESRINDIAAKVEAGQRLTAADGTFLFSPEVDLHAVGHLADLVRRRKNGDAAYYNLNHHINPTNICIYRCGLCAYSCDEGDPQAYVMSSDEVLARAKEASDAGCTELHLVSGAHPRKNFDWYLGITRELHAAFPRLQIKAWTAVEIKRFAETAGQPVRSVLKELMDAGLGSMPGGGAEIFDSQVRARICPRKVDGQTWLDVHRTAHQLGLRTNASMLYGHIETIEHRVDHLVRLRRLQDETGGFQCFVALKFHPANTAIADVEPAFATEDLRMVSVSRLMLDNFDHIKAYWVSLGVGVAQTALAYGADDLDGTVRHERIHHAAGAQSPDMLGVERLRSLIVEAGCQPVERDSLYRRVLRDGEEWRVEDGEDLGNRKLV
ncbi:MAG: aminofutalosine synthase MqnE [Planctomycetaceae bacterium]|nr:aminofutalosine synthase MqnE [Planctomycetaceae bacterium]